MEKSLLYSNAVISCRKDKLINAERIKRMLNATNFIDSAKILFECDYNQDLITLYPERDDLIINNELKKTVETFIELCPDEHVLNCVLAKYDYHNAKAFYKAKFTAVDLYEAVYPFGKIDINKLEDYIKNKKYNYLPEVLSDALINLDKNFIDIAPSAKDIDLEIEKAMYKDLGQNISKIENKNIKKYFRCEIDLNNIKTFAKCRLYKTARNIIDLLFVGGGSISKEKLDKIFDKDIEEIKNAFANSEYRELIFKLCSGIQTQDLSEFEDFANNYLIKVSSTDKFNSFKLNLLFNWFILKLEELKIVKIILTGKRLNLNKKQLKESLRGIYEDFR